MSEANDTTKTLEDYINMAEGVKRVANNKTLYLRLLKNFIAKPHIQELLGAVEQSDFKTAALEAHTIKGVAANLSFPELYAVMQTLESELKEGKTEGLDLARAQSCVETTIKYAGQLIAG
ncbi:MAG: Hpt domain-containing protein [Acidaminococcales bacterium]|jgi:HPt (histidine-containing phosphotransfer) domain-containing protein|nr:Hpt domain-containing protein [Acidaminococcales bacterium]